jgi:hypothetical protein
MKAVTGQEQEGVKVENGDTAANAPAVQLLEQIANLYERKFGSDWKTIFSETVKLNVCP